MIKEGEDYLNEAKSIAQEGNLIQEQQKALQSLAKNQFLQKKYKVAFKILEQSIILKDTIFSQDVAQQLSEANAKYETEQKQPKLRYKS